MMLLLSAPFDRPRPRRRALRFDHSGRPVPRPRWSLGWRRGGDARRAPAGLGRAAGDGGGARGLLGLGWLLATGAAPGWSGPVVRLGVIMTLVSVAAGSSVGRRRVRLDAAVAPVRGPSPASPARARHGALSAADTRWSPARADSSGRICDHRVAHLRPSRASSSLAAYAGGSRTTSAPTSCRRSGYFAARSSRGSGGAPPSGPRPSSAPRSLWCDTCSTRRCPTRWEARAGAVFYLGLVGLIGCALRAWSGSCSPATWRGSPSSPPTGPSRHDRAAPRDGGDPGRAHALTGQGADSVLRHLYLVPTIWVALGRGTVGGGLVGSLAGLLHAPIVLPGGRGVTGSRRRRSTGSSRSPAGARRAARRLLADGARAARLSAVLAIQRRLAEPGPLEAALTGVAQEAAVHARGASCRAAGRPGRADRTAGLGADRTWSIRARREHSLSRRSTGDEPGSAR